MQIIYFTNINFGFFLTQEFQFQKYILNNIKDNTRNIQIILEFSS